MVPEVIEKGMLDFGRLYKYNLIWQFWGKITFPAYGSENNEISPGTSWWWCPEDVREHYGRLRRAFFLYERPRNQQRLQTSAFSHRRNQDGRAEKYILRWKEIHFWIFAFSKCNSCLIGAAFGWWFGNRPSWRSHVCPRLEREASFKPTQLLRAAVGYTEWSQRFKMQVELNRQKIEFNVQKWKKKA